MNRYIIYLLFILTIVSCHEEIQTPVDALDAAEAVELTGAEAYIAGGATTRAAALDAYNYVGRNTFINNDQMVLTTIKRTEQPINGFHYSGIVYNQVIEGGQTSGGWNRDPNEGYAHDTDGNLLTTHPERIYWSDSHNGHTYIGYSKPQGAFDWTVKEATYGGAGTKGIPVYYGSLGDPTASGIIDYKNDADEEPVSDNNPSAPSDKSYKSGNEKIKSDDILLTFDNDKHAETGGSVAKLYFHHGLAQVRVIVNIQGFSASSTAADSWSVVSGMTLKYMLTMYRWKQQSYEAEALDATYDAANITEIYGSTVTCDQRKDVHLWIPRPNGTGAGVGKQFTFYGLAVPTTMAANNALNLQFTVSYQDPMDPWKDAQKTQPNMKDHTYIAKMSSAIEFRAGYCTTINISLNHNNEQMTVGAEYMDWQLVETPDQGELKKHDTFLTSTTRKTGTDRYADGVTIVGDPLATEDDATWLYDSGSGVILDIYGNNGTESNPYTISTADQLLSFAYEVSNGRTFENKFVKLDADLVLQPNIDIQRDNTGFYTLNSDGERVAATGGVTWLGIGDASHAFNGTFLGGNRSIKRLYGSPFFVNIGPKGRVDRLLLEEVLGVTSGGGAFATLNKGVICASTVTSRAFTSFNVEGKSETIKYNNASKESTVAGSMVGRNEGVVFACHSQGTFTTNAARVGGLVGYNTGALVVSYTATKATTTSTAPEKIYRGIVGYNDYAPDPLPDGKEANEYGSITYCFFDREVDNNVKEEDITAQVYGKTTIDMKKSDFIGENARYALMSDADKTLLASLAEKDYNILIKGSTTIELTDEEKALRDRLLSTLNGTIAYIAYHSYLCPKIINDAYDYDNTGTGTSAQLQFLIDHFLSHYYVFKVGDYPQIY